MKKLFLLIYLTGASFMSQAQSVFSSCPGNWIFYTTNNQCADVAPAGLIMNPFLRAGGGVVSLVWQISGATNAASPLTGINYIPTTQVFNVGPNFITFVATTATGKQEVCTFKRGVLELIKPVITCPKDTIQYTGLTNRYKSMTVTNPITSDNCKVAWLKWKRTGQSTDESKDSGYYNLGKQTFNKGVTNVSYTVTDYSNNTATCTFKVTIKDTVRPKLNCGSTVSTSSDSAVCSKSIALANPVYSDNCGIAKLIWSLAGATAASSSVTGINTVGTRLFNKGITTVTYISRDTAGNSSTCSTTVTVLDKTRPVVTNTAISDTLKATVSIGCVATVAIPDPLPWDACSKTFTYKWSITGATVGKGTGLVGSYSFNIGNSTINDTLIDESGNTRAFKIIVSVKDLVNPTITCPATKNLVTTVCPTSVTVTKPVMGDNCKVATLRWTLSGATSGNSPSTGINYVGKINLKTGNNIITYRAYDLSGNLAMCQQKIAITGPTCLSFAKDAVLIAEEDLKVNLLSNPAKQNFSLRLQSENSQPIEVTVYSQNGRKVDQFRARNTQVLNFGERYNTGSYHIVIRQGSLQKSITGLKM